MPDQSVKLVWTHVWTSKLNESEVWCRSMMTRTRAGFNHTFKKPKQYATNSLDDQSIYIQKIKATILTVRGNIIEWALRALTMMDHTLQAMDYGVDSRIVLPSHLRKTKSYSDRHIAILFIENTIAYSKV